MQQAIDDRSRMGVFDDMNKLMQMKAAMAMEKASESEGGSGMGMGTGLGLMMPAMFAQYFAGAQPRSDQNQSESKCPECHNSIPASSKFCLDCGHQLLVFEQCARCSKNLTPTAKFCSRCGHPAAEKPGKKFCPNCENENLVDAVFCNECGEKLG